MVARLKGVQEAAGSTPVTRTKPYELFADKKLARFLAFVKISHSSKRREYVIDIAFIQAELIAYLCYAQRLLFGKAVEHGQGFVQAFDLNIDFI